MSMFWFIPTHGDSRYLGTAEGARHVDLDYMRQVAVAADIRIAADDIRIGFNQVTLEIMPAWGGAERLAALVGKGRALMLAGSGRLLDAAEAQRLGLVDQVFPRAAFEEGWRGIARSLTHRAAGDIKKVMAGVPEIETVAGKLGRFETPTDPAPTEMLETTITLKPEWIPTNRTVLDHLLCA